jgi:hypothetical protein
MRFSLAPRSTVRHLGSLHINADSTLIENDEVYAGRVVGNPALACVAALGLEPIDDIDEVVEAAARARPDAPSGNRDRQVGVAGAGSTNQHGIAPESSAAGEIASPGSR